MNMREDHVPQDRLTDIEDGFRTLGINPDSYPAYYDPYVLASSFSICSLYDNVALTSDSCTDCWENKNA